MWNLKNETSKYNNNNNKKRCTVIENRLRVLRDTKRYRLLYIKGATRAYYTAQGI